ncbi:MAG: FKBP-type peptidylprolyl isomerase [Flavobacterium sp.]
MNNFFKTVLLFIAGISIVSCSKSSDDTEPLRDYETQKAADMANIETFMHTHYMTVVNNPGGADDQDVTFTLIGNSGQTSIWDQTTYPILTREITVRQNDEDIAYKIYYIKLRQGSGPTSQSPCNVDRVLTAYKGEYIYNSVDGATSAIISKEFETNNNPQTYFNLTGVIRGWSEIFPQFKTGTYTGNPDGTVSYENFGAGIMFIPSGLGYYSAVQSGIPAYSPLVFNFKLYEIQRVDHDGDGIYSYQEDLNGDGYVYTLPEGVANPDNTNGPGSKVLLSTNPDVYSEEDEVPDYLDTDDDGDYYTTKSETMFYNPADPAHIARYYPFNGAAVDDPTTPYVDESKGIPRKFTGPVSNGMTTPVPSDFTDTGRKRRHLDPTARPPYADQQ